MNKFQSIVYKLLYGDDNTLRFDLSGMKEYTEDYFDLVRDLSIACKKGGVVILEDVITVDENVIWDLKINRR